ncbi:ribosomal-processing cysteine protease Prp [Clostridium sp. Mt-5]|uniref:Ribosomal processing cysteine protease Prp n=1 Tax=Clostridium moutaii TaxID=3240932 RepID=A0ABV4BJR4_9CLOT
MIRAVFKKRCCNLVSVSLQGHAEWSKQGYDLVCSAVSAVSQSTVIGITEVLKLNLDYSIKNGFLNFSLEDMKEEDILKCQVLVETMLFALKSMEINYSKYINVKIEEV